MNELEKVTARIMAMPNATMFVASFKSMEDTARTLSRLSFVRSDSQGLIVPNHIVVCNFPSTKGAGIVLGGSMSVEERMEVFRLFEKDGFIESIALPKGVKPLQGTAEAAQRPWWKFW